MNDRVIPLTPSGPLWSQREYVAALRLGIQFTAHRTGNMAQWFHYGFPDDIGCTSVLIGPLGPVRYVEHDFVCGINWIEKCAAAVLKSAQ